MWRIVNPYKMARAVREHTVSYEECLAYVLIFCISNIFIILRPHVALPENLNALSPIVRALAILNVLLPLIIGYIANRGKNRDYFWYRFISIHTPVRIVMIVFVFTVYNLSSPFIDPANLSHLLWRDIIFSALHLIIFSIIIYGSMRVASSTPKKPLMQDGIDRSFHLSAHNTLSRIINPYKMALAVRASEVSGKEYLGYLCIFIILSLSNALLPAPQIETSLVRYVFYIISVSSFLISFAVAYAANQKGDNNHFWYRFISISVSVTFVLLVFFVIATFLKAGILQQTIGTSDTMPLLSWHDLLLVTIFAIIENLMVYRYMRIASS